MKINKKKVSKPSFKERLKKKSHKATMSCTDIFTFGLYKGMTLSEVINEDPEYVERLIRGCDLLIDVFAMSLLNVHLSNLRMRRKKEREKEREREREKAEFNYSDFFRRYRERLHPAYRYDHLTERAKSGKILRLTGKVTIEDIKSQYRKLALTFHADKCGQMDEVFQETAKIMFLQVQKAYEYFKKEYGI